MAVKGTFRDIAFVELLQLMGMTRKTGRIEVTTTDGKWAMIIIQEGVVWHVEPRGFGKAGPDEVIYEIIKMAEGNFVFQRVQVLPALERTVQVSTEALIMEGTKRMDERAAITEETGAGRADQVLQFKPGAEAKMRFVPQNVKRVLLAVDGKRTIQEIVQKSQLDAGQAAQIIKDLITQNVVEAADQPAAAEAPAEGA